MNEFFRTGLGKGLLIIGMVFLGVQALAGFINLRYIGAGVSPSNTISVSGHGEVDMAPDIATVTFSVVSNKSTAQEAQADATKKQNAVDAYLKTTGVAAKDIQTSGYSVYPQYDYVQQACSNGYCPGGKQVLRGYEARQTTTVKVRDLAKVGDILVGVGNAGATEVSGPNFTFDDPNAPQTAARSKAIADAKAKAEELARELGVSIVRVVSFSESSGGYPRPYALDAGMGKAEATAQSAPSISPGTNKVSDDVSITYEIR